MYHLEYLYAINKICIYLEYLYTNSQHTKKVLGVVYVAKEIRQQILIPILKRKKPRLTPVTSNVKKILY